MACDLALNTVRSFTTQLPKEVVKCALNYET